MRFLPLLLANLRRRKIRTVLTIGSFAVAMFLFGILGAIHYGFRQGIDVAGADRLVVIGRTSIMQPLPHHLSRALEAAAGRARCGARDLVRRRLPGREELLPAVRRSSPTTGAACTRSTSSARSSGRISWPIAQGCVVGTKLAQRFGWKSRRPDPAQGAGLSRRRQLGLSTCARSTTARGRATTRRSSGCGTTTSTRRRPSYWRGIVGWYVGPRRESRPGARGRQGDRRRVRQLRLGDAHADRVGVCRRLHAADGQHRVPDPGDWRRRVLHAAAGDRQHDGHRRARADERAGRAEGASDTPIGSCSASCSPSRC